MTNAPTTTLQSANPAGLRISRDRIGPNVQFRSAAGFEWTRLEMIVPDLPPALGGLRIVHLSDFHCRPWWDPAYDQLIARLRKQPPDLILFTGDFVEDKRDPRPALPVAKKLFSQLSSRLGTFAVLGNHDGDLVAVAMAESKVTFLTHRRLRLEGDGAAIELIGLPGVARLDLDLKWALSLGKKRPGTLRIILSHYPNILRKVAELQPDLYLAGHTHGGQVALPNRMPILRHDSLPRPLCKGIHRAFGSVLVVNRGFGFSSVLPLRVFCPTEVVEILTKRN
jgi:uncharacterized protein